MRDRSRTIRELIIAHRWKSLVCGVGLMLAALYGIFMPEPMTQNILPDPRYDEAAAIVVTRILGLVFAGLGIWGMKMKFDREFFGRDPDGNSGRRDH